MSFILKNPLAAPIADNTPSLPPYGMRGLFPKSDGWYEIDSDGNVVKIGTGDGSSNPIIDLEVSAPIAPSDYELNIPELDELATEGIYRLHHANTTIFPTAYTYAYCIISYNSRPSIANQTLLTEDGIYERRGNIAGWTPWTKLATEAELNNKVDKKDIEVSASLRNLTADKISTNIPELDVLDEGDEAGIYRVYSTVYDELAFCIVSPTSRALGSQTAQTLFLDTGIYTRTGKLIGTSSTCTWTSWTKLATSGDVENVKPFIIKVIIDGNDNITADKTFEELVAAHEDGKELLVNLTENNSIGLQNVWCPIQLAHLSDEFQFTAIFNGYSTVIKCNVNNGWSYVRLDFATLEELDNKVDKEDGKGLSNVEKIEVDGDNCLLITYQGSGNPTYLQYVTFEWAWEIFANKNELNRVEEIAKGRATGKVFDSKAKLLEWLDTGEQFSLNLGDNLYIRDTGVPDYWWDGESIQELETQKVHLDEYVKNTDYATGEKAGVVKAYSRSTSSTGVGISESGILYMVPATDYDIDNKALYRAITPNNINYAVQSCTNQELDAELTEEQLKLPPSTQAFKDAIGDIDTALENIITKYGLGGDVV